MKWLRLYDDLLDDPKVQQLPPAIFKHWINLLCLASKTEPRGTLPGLSAIAFRLRLAEPKAAALLADLKNVGLIDAEANGTLRPHNWEGRQRASDNVADRVRKHRESVSGNDSVTLQKRTVDSDTETEQETDTEVPSVDGKRARLRTVKTPIPDNMADVVPADAWAAMGREQRLSDEQLRFETDAMLDHYRGKGERRADWVATWRTWMRSPYRQSKPRNGHAPPNGNGPGHRPKFNAQGQRVYTLADLREDERHDDERDQDAVVEAASRLVPHRDHG